jgi:hypothetical protein
MEGARWVRGECGTWYLTFSASELLRFAVLGCGLGGLRLSVKELRWDRKVVELDAG